MGSEHGGTFKNIMPPPTQPPMEALTNVLQSSLQSTMASNFYWMLPGFALKQMILGNYCKTNIDPDILDSIDFMVERLESIGNLITCTCKIFHSLFIYTIHLHFLPLRQILILLLQQPQEVPIRTTQTPTKSSVKCACCLRMFFQEHKLVGQ